MGGDEPELTDHGGRWSVLPGDGSFGFGPASRGATDGAAGAWLAAEAAVAGERGPAESRLQPGLAAPQGGGECSGMGLGSFGGSSSGGSSLGRSMVRSKIRVRRAR